MSYNTVLAKVQILATKSSELIIKPNCNSELVSTLTHAVCMVNDQATPGTRDVSWSQKMPEGKALHEWIEEIKARIPEMENSVPIKVIE